MPSGTRSSTRSSRTGSTMRATGRAEVGDGGLEVDRTARAGMGEEIGDVDAECAHAVAAWNERTLETGDAPVDGDRPPVGRT